MTLLDLIPTELHAGNVAGLSVLKRVLVGFPLVWTGAWLGYYAYTDTLRRSHVRQRIRTMKTTLGETVDYAQPASEAERAAIKQRFASLRFAGRYWNPYIEWREQGAWEWALWKGFLSVVTLKLWYDGGVPKNGAFEDLPLEKPDFGLLFGSRRTSEKEPQGADDVQVTDKLTMTWLGQSTSYVTLDSLAILTDPALSTQTLDSRLAPTRLRPSPCSLADLRRIDIVLVSHNHYDHLQTEAVLELGDRCQWIVPLGVGAFLRSLGLTRVVELDWWAEHKLRIPQPTGGVKEYTVTSVPLMHWSARTPLDTNASLWCGYHVRSDSSDPPRSFLHLGDTGYSSTLSHAVGRYFGPVDLAAIPIGSYEPRWHMHLQHTDPEGAVRMAQHMHVKKSVGVHWGTWLMSDEAYNKPPIDLALARKKLDMAEEQFVVMPVGRTLVVD